MESLKKEVTISTVTPVYTGSDYLESLVEKLKQVRDKWIEQAAPIKLIESIFVDDGSIDDSSEVLKQLAEKYNWVNVITLSKNYGQHSATIAGIVHTSSDWAVTLDEDLQHDPEMIETLLREAVMNKSDVIYAKPKGFSHGNTWRDKSSNLVKSLMARLTGMPQITMFNSFRLIRGSIARSAASSSSSQTYLDIAISWHTSSAGVIYLNMKDERFTENEKSGYAFKSLLRHGKRLMVSSELNIASAGLWAGIVFILLSLLIGANVFIGKLLYPEIIDVRGWASLVSILCAFGGITIALICIIMEYVNIVLINQLGRPTFFITDRSSDATLREWFSRDKRP